MSESRPTDPARPVSPQQSPGCTGSGGVPAGQPPPGYYHPRQKPPRPRPRSQPVFRWILVVILGIHAAIAFTQSILAGAYLSGSLDAMTVHGALGSGLTVITMIQGVVCLLFVFPGRGPWWPLVASVVLFFVEGMQVGMGYTRTLGLHIPLGVAIILTVTLMFVWSLRWKSKQPKAVGR